jgi:hypothetical protein
MMSVFSWFSPKKVPFEDTTEAVVVEGEAVARRAAVAGGRGGRRGCPPVVAAAAHRRRHRCPSPLPAADDVGFLSFFP